MKKKMKNKQEKERFNTIASVKRTIIVRVKVSHAQRDTLTLGQLRDLQKNAEKQVELYLNALNKKILDEVSIGSGIVFKIEVKQFV